MPPWVADPRRRLISCASIRRWWNPEDRLHSPTGPASSNVAMSDTCEVDGVVWQPLRSSGAVADPDRYGSGGDSMLFTGVALAGWTWKYAVTGDSDRVIEAVRGLWILTHVAGRGVLCRAAFPSSSRRRVRLARRVGGSRSALRRRNACPRDRGSDPRRPPPGDALVHARHEGPAHRPRARTLVRVDARDGPGDGSSAFRAASSGRRADRRRRRPAPARTRMADPGRGGQNDTSADDVDGLLRLAVLGLARAVGMPDADQDYQREFARLAKRADPLGAFDRYNNVEQYYAHSLRAARSYSIWLLDEDPAAQGADGRLRPHALEALDRPSRECVARVAMVRHGRHSPRTRRGCARCTSSG